MIIPAACLLLAALMLVAGCTGTAEKPRAAPGDNVSVDYTVSFLNGTVYESSVGRAPLTFTLGKGKVIAGFDKAVTGLAVNESVNVTIPVEEAYGEYNSTLVIIVPRESLPADTGMGQRFVFPNIDSKHVYTVTAVNETTLMLDGNHPLAGNDLRFSITLLSLQKAAAA
ncbi:FKBP-type peptidyl-prolyl cis-trans isomerase [Methanofollis ethanolicus]|uniref:FKBP-type peptidyl-prolyl cis-trans isomerase n=1 Tax=Methanofollis ethanolicus TaxID=488124 RepID=UPI001366380D|nr:peptidylprolyl isomerase [Methanofollis ethanolicus]